MSGDDEDDRSMRDRIADDQGYDSYEDAPVIVQNVIDFVVDGAEEGE